MKRMKFMLIILMMLGAASTIQAQEVFDIVLKKAESIVNNPRASEFELKVNQFKLTALRYIPNTGIRLNGNVSTELMDIQAYSLNVFITQYFSDLQKTPVSDRKKLIMKYVEATRKYPLYDDKDTETTEAFVKDPGGYTPFSINVNWQNAIEEVSKK